MIVGQRIRIARKNKNLTQQELGNILGVSKVSICGYENGTRIPTLENFIQLLDTLEVNSNYLLGRDLSVSCEDEEEYTISIAKEDLSIINELKKYADLYNKLIQDYKRTIQLIDKRMKK